MGEERRAACCQRSNTEAIDCRLRFVELLDLFPILKKITYLLFVVNSLTPKSIPAGTKLVLFGRYVLNIYVGIV